MKRQGGRPVLLVSGRPLTEAQAARLIVAEARQLVQVSGLFYGIDEISLTLSDLCEYQATLNLKHKFIHANTGSVIRNSVIIYSSTVLCELQRNLGISTFDHTQMQSHRISLSFNAS